MNSSGTIDNRAQEGNQERKWALVLLASVSLLLFLTVCAIIPQWIRAGESFFTIPFTLHSVSEADYSADPHPKLIPGVNLSIVEDILRDLDPGAENIDTRVDSVMAQLSTPVPTATYSQNSPIPTTSATQNILPTPAATTSISLTPTHPPASTSTEKPTRTPTQTATPAPTQTKLPPPPPTRTPTETDAPPPDPTSTSTPTDTLTPSPTASSTPTPADTPTPTDTPMPTDTPTSTPSACSTPNPVTGFVTGTSPIDGSVNVPLGVQPVIFFNQSMDAATLIYGDNTHFALCSNAGCPPAQIVAATVSIQNNLYLNDQVTVIPDAPLAPNLTYYLVAGTLVQNHADCGNVLQAVRVITSFTTAP